MQFTAKQRNDLYKDTITNLSLQIQGKFGTIEKFCKASGMSCSTLFKTLNHNINQEMSVETFLSIKFYLKRPANDESKSPFDGIKNGVSLKQYLMIDNNLLLLEIMETNLNL